MKDKAEPSIQKRRVIQRILVLVWAAIILGLLIGEAVLITKYRNGQQVLYVQPLDVLLLFWSFILAIVLVAFLICYVGPMRFRQWLFSRRIVRRMLIALAWVVTIIALFYGEENWRGRRAWNKYSRELAASGAQLDFKAFIPKPIPDEQNFAATPFIKSWFVRDSNGEEVVWGDRYVSAEKMVSSTASKSRTFVDLVAWGMAFDAVRAGQTNSNSEFKTDKLDPASRTKVAPSILSGLGDCDSRLVELRAASLKPSSQYPVVYNLDNPWGMLLPHLYKIKKSCSRLQLRACAELAANRSDDALKDVKLALDVADSVKDEPFLISPLVRFACLHITIQPVWEGLAERRWSDAQLLELQTHLQQYDFIATLKYPFDAERAAGVLTADLLAAGKYRFADLINDNSKLGGSAANVFSRVAPRGWYEMEKLNYCRLRDVQLDGAFDLDGKRVFPSRLESNSQALERAFAGRNPVTTICTRHQLLAVIMLPALGKIPVKAAAAQVVADQAVIACGLERYRLANGRFPETLDALLPKFISRLPSDPLTGQTYKYRRTNDGQFVLYSIGWDEKDDGGVPGKELFDQKSGDWVWQYLAN